MRVDLMHKVFSYVVATDTGVAPNVDGGVCTVCLCKPEIRRNAMVGDWIVGLWPMPDRFRLTYVMRVARKLALRDYHECGEFDQKKPDRSQTPDNIYQPDPPFGLRRREDAPAWLHPKPEQTRKDLGGRNALIADLYWYFGGTVCELPERLWELDFPDPSARRYVKKTYLNDAKLSDLVEWLDGHGHGVIGTPRSNGTSRKHDASRPWSKQCSGSRESLNVRHRRRTC